MSKYLLYCTDSMVFCCGAHEVGSMRVVDTEVSSFSPYDRRGDRVELERAIATILDKAEGRPVFFNFVQIACQSIYCEFTGEFEENYIAQEFMDLVMVHPRTINLGTWINPGTGNRIHGFMIKGKRHE